MNRDEFWTSTPRELVALWEEYAEFNGLTTQNLEAQQIDLKEFARW